MKKEFKAFLSSKKITEEAYKDLKTEEKAELFSEFQTERFAKLGSDLGAITDKQGEIENVVNGLKETAKSFATTADVTKLSGNIAKLQDALDAQAEKGKKAGSGSTIRQMLESNIEGLKKFLADRETNRNSIYRFASPIETSDVTISGTVPPLADWSLKDGIAEDLRRQPRLLELLDRGSTNRPVIPYLDKTANSGAAALVNEGAQKPIIDWGYVKRYSEAVKVAGIVKVTEETLQDIAEMESIIRGELRYEHDIAVDNAVNTFISSYASTFVTGASNPLYHTQANGSMNEYDAIKAVITNVYQSTFGRYTPSAVLMNIADWNTLGSLKATPGTSTSGYMVPPFLSPDGRFIQGVQIIPVVDSNIIAAGDFIVGDFNRIKYRNYIPFSLRVGHGIHKTVDTIDDTTVVTDVKSDWETNWFDFIGESRFHIFGYDNDRKAIIKASYSTVISNVEKTS